ncbi:hypothetical protein TNCV_1024901 [Trichonephila clavipes]|nr:hypothetical protein TNCV_1024901 [Trichonephila clavipes]
MPIVKRKENRMMVSGKYNRHHVQNKVSAKAKASKNKSAAPVENNEVQSDFGENSMPIVKRKENRMTVLGKNNRYPCSRSPTKRIISRTYDKQSKNVICNGNISEPANGLRRSTRFRLCPLWTNGETRDLYLRHCPQVKLSVALIKELRKTNLD